MDVEDGVKALEVREEEHRVEGATGEGVPAMCFLEQVLPIHSIFIIIISIFMCYLFKHRHYFSIIFMLVKNSMKLLKIKFFEKSKKNQHISH